MKEVSHSAGDTMHILRTNSTMMLGSQRPGLLPKRRARLGNHKLGGNRTLARLEKSPSSLRRSDKMHRQGIAS